MDMERKLINWMGVLGIISLISNALAVIISPVAYPGYLDEVIGVYQTPQAYYVDDADVEEFDKNFPAKEKLKLPDQIFG